MVAQPPHPTDRHDRMATEAQDGGAAVLHLLQPLLAPMPGRPAALYLRLTPEPEAPLVPDAPIRLPQRGMLSTNTFFGSFYRAYWQPVAGLDRVILALDIAGAARVRMMEATDTGTECLYEDLVSGPAQIVPGPARGASGRLYVEVEAISDCTISRMDWMTDQPPRRRTTLSVGLCTFNQETYLTRTLEALIVLADRMPVIRRIHVINQGAAFTSDALKALCRDPRINLVEQRNLGGCGGFTRSLVEELAEADPASHHLLMDDDIVLDERLIARSLRFLDYAREEIALGAGMFDNLRPEIMYEAGAYLPASNKIEPYCHNVDLSDPEALSHFNARVETDYNAWWFCILPLDTVRRAGLPIPVFIRGDDFEYGLRMLQEGTATITLPGTGVWHDPFYAKPPGWQEYYDLRNRLILGAVFPGRVDQLPTARAIGVVTTALLTHNYAAARLRLLALADFLKGPALLDEDASAVHDRVMALARTATAERLGPEWADRPVRPSAPPGSRRTAALAWQQAVALLRNTFGPHRRRDAILMETDARPRAVAGTSYVITNEPRSYHLRFTPDRRELWRLMRETFAMARRYRAESAKTGAAWAASIDRYRRPDFWRKVFTADSRSA